MNIKLSMNEWDALAAIIAEHAPHCLVQSLERQAGGRLELSNESADEIRNLCEDKLLAIGFDANYEPNQQGLLLESLIDKLFAGQ